MATLSELITNIKGKMLPLTGGTLTGALTAPSVSITNDNAKVNGKDIVRSVNGTVAGTDGNVALTSVDYANSAGSATNDSAGRNIVDTYMLAAPARIRCAGNGSNNNMDFIRDGFSGGYYLNYDRLSGDTWQEIVTTTGGQSINGTLYAGAYQISSDRRLKSDLKKIDSALEKVSQLAAYTYNKQGVDGRQAGVIAQDVEKVLPEAVRENDEGYKTVDYSALTALLINAINELRGEINGIKLS